MSKKAIIIGVPMDLGAGRRGVDMGPSAIRIGGLNQAVTMLGYDVVDAGNINVHPPEAIVEVNPRARYLKEIAGASRELAEKVEAALDEGAIPIILGGDHSIAIGSVSGVAAYYRKRGEKIGIIWLDAHPDINTPSTTPSGNIHGMPLAAILGHGPRELTEIAGFAPKVLPENVAIIGARSIDPGERELIKTLGLRVFTMSELDERGMAQVISEAIEIASRDTAAIHATMDMDFIDPFYAPGVGTPEPGGATFREAHLAMEKMAASGRVVCVEVTEVNPLYDQTNQTGQLAVGMVLSALGKRII
ncbi:MAG TPA: arginase [Blastocatellia bacterium]|jgi:arginase